MLDSLNELHAAILAAAGEAELLVSALQPDTERLAATRFKIARFSSQRTKLLENTIYPTLLQHLSAAEAAKIQHLRDERLRGLAQTAHHIGAWGHERIRAEWREYQSVFKELLAGLQTRVAAEKAVLVPAIERVRNLNLASVVGIERELRFSRATAKAG